MNLAATALEMVAILAHDGVLAAGIDPPAVPCCWLSVGAFARGDQFEHELPAIAVIYDDAAEG